MIGKVGNRGAYRLCALTLNPSPKLERTTLRSGAPAPKFGLLYTHKSSMER
jgi:hypothetical protein